MSLHVSSLVGLIATGWGCATALRRQRTGRVWRSAGWLHGVQLPEQLEDRAHRVDRLLDDLLQAHPAGVAVNGTHLDRFGRPGSVDPLLPVVGAVVAADPGAVHAEGVHAGRPDDPSFGVEEHQLHTAGEAGELHRVPGPGRGDDALLAREVGGGGAHAASPGPGDRLLHI